MSSEADVLWLRLKAAGLVNGEPPPSGSTASPWFVRAMLGVAAWIGSAFLILFASLFLSGSSEETFLGVGLVACAVAAVLLRQASEDADFAVQLGLAVSLAGQGLALYALIEMLGVRTSGIALTMACFEVLLFIAVPNFVHRVWSAGSCAVACAVALADWRLHLYVPGLMAAGCAWIWLHEFQYVKSAKMIRACGYGLVLALIGASAWILAIPLARNAPSTWDGHQWIAAGLNGAVLMWVVWGLLAREAIDQYSRVGVSVLAATSILALTTLKAPGLAPTVLILLLGYGNGNLVLMGLGVAALLGYLSFYYYSLETTLLYKSVLMGATGLGLLAARLGLQAVLTAGGAGGATGPSEAILEDGRA